MKLWYAAPTQHLWCRMRPYHIQDLLLSVISNMLCLRRLRLIAASHSAKQQMKCMLRSQKDFSLSLIKSKLTRLFCLHVHRRCSWMLWLQHQFTFYILDSGSSTMNALYVFFKINVKSKNMDFPQSIYVVGTSSWAVWLASFFGCLTSSHYRLSWLISVSPSSEDLRWFIFQLSHILYLDEQSFEVRYINVSSRVSFHVRP
jgi:hypothetical protein